MDDVAGTKENVNGFAYRNDHFRGCEIIFSSRVFGFDSKFVLDAEEFHIPFAKFAVCTGITDIPAKLVTYYINRDGIWGQRSLGEFMPDAIAPDSEEQEDRGGNDGPPEFQRVVTMAVVGFVARTATVADQVDNVDGLSEDEYSQRQNENKIEQHVDLSAADCDIWRGPVKIAGAFFCASGHEATTKKGSYCEKKA